MRLLARGLEVPSVVPALHQAALELTPAVVSVLVRPDPVTGQWTAMSGAGMETLALGPWLTTRQASEAAGRALSGDEPLVLGSLAHEVPELASLLGTPSAVLVPLIGVQPLGLLLLGLPDGAAIEASSAAMLGDAMVVALERARAAEELAQHRDVAELMQAFARGGATPMTLVPALELVARGIGRLMVADVVELWIHDRTARELVCAAASDPRGRVQAARVATADSTSLVAAALRRDRAELVTASDAGVLGTSVGLVVPLRGRRRALGVLAAYGIRLEPGSEVPLLDRANEIARQLSTVLENVQLLDDVVRSKGELERLEHRLGQSEKLLALGQFVAGVAHELNNPLQGVLGHLELMRATRDLPPALGRDLALVHREADRAARIVRNLLVFAGSGKLQRRPLSLNAVATRVLRGRAAAHLAAGITVTRRLADDLPKIKGDALLLHQALLNFVLNAEQAMPDGGRLLVATDALADGSVRVSVEDDGPGLSSEVRARLFEPFFTTKDVGTGTGLGLAITYGIVQAHGGAIEADNHSGGGARFAITLPVLP
jgi:signal transduction histidine kinase